MKFLDQAKIYVKSGNGGNGCISFRREKYVEFGGPNGGGGGRGGDVIVLAVGGLNTLIDYRYHQHIKAENGRPGLGKDMTGAAGKTAVVKLPVGTQIFAEDNKTCLADLTVEGQEIRLLVGGDGGYGNAHFKSSTNRAPRRADPGHPGQELWIWLRLKLLADAGLVGLPNAGKSTFIRSVSAARPKVADYPFTTLVPNLGVVGMSGDKSFVIADIPGLIEGASEGAGLGIRFLKHLTRTRLLLHLVDMMPYDGTTPDQNARVIETELETFSPTLASGDRWLVLNKIDLLPEDEVEGQCQQVVDALGWEGPVFRMSGLASQGTKALCAAIMDYIDEHRQQEEADPDLTELADKRRAVIQAEARERIEGLAQARRQSRQQPQENDDEDDDHDVEVVYAE